MVKSHGYLKKASLNKKILTLCLVSLTRAMRLLYKNWRLVILHKNGEKRSVNWDDDGDEIDYQLIHEESGRFLTARELSLTVEKKGKVSFLFSKSDAMN